MSAAGKWRTLPQSGHFTLFPANSSLAVMERPHWHCVLTGMSAFLIVGLDTTSSMHQFDR